MKTKPFDRAAYSALYDAGLLKPKHPRVNLGPDAHINVTPETRRYRQQAIDGMKQAQAAQRQAAHAALLAAKEKKDRAARREARKCA